MYSPLEVKADATFARYGGHLKSAARGRSGSPFFLYPRRNQQIINNACQLYWRQNSLLCDIKNNVTNSSGYFICYVKCILLAFGTRHGLCDI